MFITLKRLLTNITLKKEISNEKHLSVLAVALSLTNLKTSVGRQHAAKLYSTAESKNVLERGFLKVKPEQMIHLFAKL